ncbi:hypothetical protein CR162_19085 [Pseudoroseomonas rhizosphaerae]|uniref:Glycoside hydrolase family 5 domain-containing protein n=1 Tax=Teichococcus rhizosphaerae TaxID=1335062 RepID=A0A2C7A6U0_9PROT|nr:cellulase family glycosylhydrolase [Pseudoroseomonas rhizosphaerae]PHK93333.1 hypothetical protein CR162_19085 [Pseudoroseomonas rhizosphaerae]
MARLVRRRGMLGTVVCAAGGATPPPRSAHAAEPPGGTAWRRARQLGPGVNLSLWQDPLGAPAAGEGHGTLAEVAALGFRHVRLPVDPAAAVAGMRQGPDVARRMAERLADDIAAARRHGLAAILDMHPSDAFRQRLASDPGERRRFAGTWAVIARALSGLDPEGLVFELLNEPGEALGPSWHGLQAELARAVRGEAPEHTILAAGANFSTVADLRRLAPLPDANLIYSFHCYAPMLFTHQGADWAPPFARVSGVPYPLSLRHIRAVEAAMPPEERPVIAEEGRGGHGWDAARLEALLAQAGAWSRQRGLPVICTEFGAFRDGGADPADRRRYLADMRSALARHAQAWTLWDYSGGFGVVREERGSRQIDRPMLRALGLG